MTCRHWTLRTGQCRDDAVYQLTYEGRDLPQQTYCARHADQLLADYATRAATLGTTWHRRPLGAS
jgi:hypothetical protein